MKLSNSDLHIWHIPLGGARLLEETFAPLPSEAETLQAAKFTHPELHQCYLKTRWAMRNILGLYLSTDPNRVQIRYAELGKPELIPGSHPLDLRFNLTHSGNGALLAVMLETEVGIDMEKKGHKPRPLRLAKRYFTAEVVQQLEGLDEAQQQTALLKLWTQYESYKKAQGVGLRGGDELLPLDFKMPDNEFQPFPMGHGESSDWVIAQLALSDDYVGAITIERGHGMVEMSHIYYEAVDFSIL